MPRRPGIGEAELEILHHIHERHPITVREVAEHVTRTKGHARTTVLNVMTRLWRKRYLTRRKVNGVFVYEPRVPKGDLMRSMVSDFVQRALGGSLSPFVAYLAEDADVSDADLQELKKVVRELDVNVRRQDGEGDRR